MHQGFHVFPYRCLSHVWNQPIYAIKRGALNHHLLHRLLQFFEKNPTLLRFKNLRAPLELPSMKASLQSISGDLEVEFLRSLQALIAWILQLGNFLDLCHDYDIFVFLQSNRNVLGFRLIVLAPHLGRDHVQEILWICIGQGVGIRPGAQTAFDPGTRRDPL